MPVTGSTIVTRPSPPTASPIPTPPGSRTPMESPIGSDVRRESSRSSRAIRPTVMQSTKNATDRYMVKRAMPLVGLVPSICSVPPSPKAPESPACFGSWSRIASPSRTVTTPSRIIRKVTIALPHLQGSISTCHADAIPASRISRKLAASRLAPPTKAPSTTSRSSKDLAFSGVTLPP